MIAMEPGDPSAIYRAREARATSQRDAHEALSRRLARARAVSFLVGAAIVGWVAFGPGSAPGWLGGVGAVLLAAFGALVIWHARVDDRRAWADARAAVNRHALSRMARDWDALPPDSPPRADDGPMAEDLDLFGRASLMQLLGPATAWGRSTLRRWLLAPAEPARIRDRQAAVADLVPRLDLRQDFAARGLLASAGRDDDRRRLEALIAWVDAGPWLSRRTGLRWCVRASAAATVGAIVLQAAGAIDVSAWILPLAVNLGLVAMLQSRVHESLDRAAAADDALGHYAHLLELADTATMHAPLLDAIRARLTGAGEPAHRQLRTLDRLNGFANLRRSAAILHFPVHVVTLWDFHVLERLERWQADVGPRVADWLAATGELDALCALASLAHAHPTWCTPEIVDVGARVPEGGADGSAPTPPSAPTPERDVVLEAVGLGHPLIPPASRVDNDVEVGPPGTLLLVTGSNMSGKSTLLRAIGLGAALAYAGGPVCARALRMPVVTVETSMRVHDSLDAGVSYFMAALRRLRDVVESVRAAERDGRRVLYLLDEILQGTNTAERRIASRAIVGALVAHGAIGAVTTHDLELIDDPGLEAASRTVHFTEHVHERDGGVEVEFDYRLRPGLATSRNALALMRMIGLSDLTRSPRDSAP